MPKESLLIVGHGLAGAFLAQTFIDRGKQVDVMDGNFPYHSSKVAAGLVNPLIGPKLNPPDQIKKCLLAIQAFNNLRLNKNGISFYDNLSLFRIFNHPGQAERWRTLSKHHFEFTSGTEVVNQAKAETFGFIAPFGMGNTNCLQLHVGRFLEYSKQSLIESGNWIDAKFIYDEATYDKVIFCEGFRAKYNPWFSFLPFSPVRGEILKIRKSISTSASNGTWAIKSSDQNFIAGSTWDHEKLERGPTEKGKEEIINNLAYLQRKELEVIDHLSGVRTGTPDRHPIMGEHPKNKRLYIFNGFGSRGSTTIPLYAQRMVDFVLHGTPLPEHVRIDRFDASKMKRS